MSKNSAQSGACMVLLGDQPLTAVVSGNGAGIGTAFVITPHSSSRMVSASVPVLRTLLIIRQSQTAYRSGLKWTAKILAAA
ncbi:hypothetical protein [Rhizobium mongolense]|uniref:Ribonucleotide monophosphatase NagD (HAD superfamily) n=1 Tax=Rhizobium mongolense TaxID=57676 RepID=A0A7W6RMT3_9HYPH|nr:hypothetical protein [Rhizobium mongolense]MBB4275147.1 ribonucleotide monophosphatase NagD (HAD superfamily) [Rhizobium mongolense]